MVLCEGSGSDILAESLAVVEVVVVLAESLAVVEVVAVAVRILWTVLMLTSYIVSIILI